MTSDCIHFTLKIDSASTFDTRIGSTKAKGHGRYGESLICLRILITYEDKARVSTGEAPFLSVCKLFALSYVGSMISAPVLCVSNLHLAVSSGGRSVLVLQDRVRQACDVHLW